MNQQAVASPREHHFYVAIAKHLFQHPEYGIVTVRDSIRIKDAEHYKLTPLILYGLTVAGLPIRWMTFTSVDQPRAFMDVLLDAWQNALGLRGRPDILRISRHLATASPELIQSMAKIEVRVEVADAKEKSLPASLRAAQNASKWLVKGYNNKERPLTIDIQGLCHGAQHDHDLHAWIGCGGVSSREVKDRLQRWLALPAQEPVEKFHGGLDWKPGPWLAAWESALPPDSPRYFNNDGPDGRIWLLAGEKEPEDIVDDDSWVDSDHDNAPELAKNLVACWPNPPVEIAKCAGITLRELQWFALRKAPLQRHARYALEELLGVEYDESMGGYVGAGPYVLMAQNAKALEEVYEGISKGGDARPYEVIPSHGAADPSWRYIIINTYGESPSIVMSPRGEKITERLPDLLLNYAGITPVSPEVYRDVVSTCARACREPAANIREMKNFAKRWNAP